MAKTKQELLAHRKAQYDKLWLACSIIPDEIPLESANVYSVSVDFHTTAMSVADYHKFCEHLIDWEMYSYNYLGNHYSKERVKRLSVCHRIEIGDAYTEDGFFIEIHFSIHTAQYKKFLDFISDGKCKIETRWVTPKNEPYETTTLTCGG